MTKRKICVTIAAASLCVAVGVGSTIAYLSAMTGTKTNTFTMGSGISGETQEPSWKEENAKDYVPGRVIAKDPLIKNLSKAGTDDAYAAMKISYQKAVKDDNGNFVSWIDTTYADLDQFINIQTNGMVGFSNDWTMEDDNTTAYFNAKLPAQASTQAVFTDVEIDPLALTEEQVESAGTDNIQFDKTKYEVQDESGNVTSYSYAAYTMTDFQIVVTGYMVQSEGFADAKTAIQTAFPNVF